MIKPELYKKTVDILYQAYFNDELEHGNCAACAVGNICAGNGIPRHHPDLRQEINNASWRFKFMTRLGQQRVKETAPASAMKVIRATGYTWRQLARIEYAFETAWTGYSKEDHMFNGLVAVLEVLKEIHQVTDADEINNERFESHYKTRSKVLG